jgi:hypothetical protein
LWVGKPVFNVFNAIVYTLCTLIVYKHANYGKSANAPLYILIHVAYFLFSPVWGQTNLWLAGSCNYLWGSTLILAFLLPFRILAENKNILSRYGIIWAVAFFFFGALAGACNENTSAAAVFAVMLLGAFIKWYKKRKLPAWFFTGLAGSMIGWIIMVAAPGNFIRAQNTVYQDSRPLVIKLLGRFGAETELLGNMKWILIFFAFAIILALHAKVKLEKMLLTFIFFLTAMACNYVMIFSPDQSFRAFTGVSLFLLIAAGMAMVNLEIKNIRIASQLLASAAAVFFVFQLSPSADYILQTYLRYQSRAEYVLQQITMGSLDIISDAIVPKTKHNALYLLEDIQTDSDHWVNKSYARYYGINTITATENPQD